MPSAKAINAADKDYIKHTAKNILELDGQLAAARFLAQTLFAGITELGGAPYFGHLERVAAGVTDNRTKAIGYMHDLIEDIEDWDFADLEDIGFDDFVINGVRAVTKSGKPYFDEMVGVGQLPQARAVKLSDLRDNTNILRLAHIPTDKDLERCRKYFLSWNYLTDIDNGTTPPGTRFIDWMKAKPAAMQNWQLAEKYSSEQLPPAQSLQRQFQP